MQNILVDAGYSGEKFANSVSEILGCTVGMWQSAMRCIFLRLFLKDGLWKGHFLVWIKAENYEKTVQMIVLAFSVLLVKRL